MEEGEECKQQRAVEVSSGHLLIFVRAKEKMMERLITTSYLTQRENWPDEGRHILAQYDEQSVVVYQAFKPTIGRFAATHGFFGGGFRLDRTSWVKTNFLWMMYRSQWGTAPQQETVLAVFLKRDAFDWLLSQAVHSLYHAELYPSDTVWYAQLSRSPVVLQWDPDHAPTGQRLSRRAIQLGLRGEVLVKYAREWIVAIEDISEFVAQQRSFVKAKAFERLQIPYETVYPVADSEVAARLLLAQKMLDGSASKQTDS